MTEEALVQIPGMLASTGQPGGDGDLSKAEDTLSSRRIQSFGQRRQHHCDLVRGGFQTKEGRVEPGSERSVAGLTAKGLDPLGTSMLAIPDQSTNVCVCDFKVGTLSAVFTRFGAPRRLFTSRQGRTGRGAGSSPDEGVEARRQAGQSCGERGFRRRWSVVRLASPLEEKGRSWNQSRRQRSVRVSMRKTTSRNMNT